MLPALAMNGSSGHVEVTANSLQDIIDCERFVVSFDGTVDDALCEPDVYVTIIDNAKCHERVDDTLKVTNTSIGCLGYKVDNVVRYLKPIATNFTLENINTELLIRLLELCNESTCETSKEPLRHTLQIDRRPITGHNDTFPVSEKMVEDMEECVLRLRSRYPFLNIIDDEHIDGLIEMDEIVDGTLPCCIDELYLEKSCTDVKHSTMRIELLDSHSDGINQMRFPTS